MDGSLAFLIAISRQPKLNENSACAVAAGLYNIIKSLWNSRVTGRYGAHVAVLAAQLLTSSSNA